MSEAINSKVCGYQLTSLDLSMSHIIMGVLDMAQERKAPVNEEIAICTELFGPRREPRT